MKAKLNLICMFILRMIIANGQLNIVPNSGFEQSNFCPNAMGQMNSCMNWQNTAAPAQNITASPDYYKTCGTNLANCPNTGFGTCPPKSGTGMIGLVCWNQFYPDFREYATNQLNCNMIPNVTYTVSFWIRNASPTLQGYTIDRIGVLFTNGAVTQSGPNNSNYAPILQNPQFETNGNQAYTNWHQITFTIIPTSTWHYLTIGCFRSDNGINVNNTWPSIIGSYVANYYFDDVQIFAPNSPLNLYSNIQQTNCNSNNSGIINTPNLNYSYTYTWSSGNFTTNTASNLPPGPYSVSVTAANGCTNTTQVVQFTINPTPPTPSITVIASNTLYCANHSLTLTVSGANNYTWIPSGLNGSTIVVSPTVATVYTVIGSNSFGCTNTATFMIGAPMPNPTLALSVSTFTRCDGTPVTLTGFGAANYLWLPSNQTGTNIVVNPTTTTSYSFIGTAPNGCTSVATATVGAPIPNPTIQVTASTTLICSGIPITLTASGANTYFWTPINSNGSSIVVNPTNTTTYYVFGNSIAGCQGFATISLSLGTVINLSANDVTLCTNAATSTMITANSNSGGNINYLWLPPNLNGQNISVSPNSNMIYTVTATSALFCPNTTTMAVSITTNCCSQPTNGLTQLTSISGSYANSSYFISNNITLSNSCNFSNSEILIMPGVQITIPPNMNINFDQTHLYACGLQMWQGIDVQDMGSISTSGPGTSMIEDAMVAINLDNISTSHANPPILLQRMVFNKNYIGIKMSNSSSSISHLPIEIKECVFTSRNIPFTSTSWPSSDITPTGLRFAAPGATLGLPAPYILQSHSPGNLKVQFPALNQVAQTSHIGIKIENIGNATNFQANNHGVEFGFTFSSLVHEFNLFDELGIGIDVENASLSTMNNVFQNMHQIITNSGTFGGFGIKHEINSLMNAKLNLSPNPINTTTDYGNRFWNCVNAIEGNNVYELSINYAVIRSTHIGMNALNTGTIGYNGIVLGTNRFNYQINHSEFNNIANSVSITTFPGNYDVGNGTQFGIFANKLNINENYFGPEVNSTNPLMPIPTNQYLSDGIHLKGINGSFWQTIGIGQIIGNKFDRVFRAISVMKMMDYPIEIGGNSINLENDNTYPPPMNLQYGIESIDSQGNLSVRQNTLNTSAFTIPLNNNVTMMYFKDNVGIQSPQITCNLISNAYKGIEFDGVQTATFLDGNSLFLPMNYGLSLTNFGEIGQQGTPTLASGNRWFGNWVGNQFNTLCDASSDPSLSQIFVELFSTATPPNHFGIGMFVYTPLTFISALPGTGNDCLNPYSYPVTPSQRPSNLTTSGVSELNYNEGEFFVEFYPNPASGQLYIHTLASSTEYTFKLFELTGKLVYSEKLNNEKPVQLNTIKDGLYIVEVSNPNGKIVRNKLIVNH